MWKVTMVVLVFGDSGGVGVGYSCACIGVGDGGGAGVGYSYVCVGTW